MTCYLFYIRKGKRIWIITSGLDIWCLIPVVHCAYYYRLFISRLCVCCKCFELHHSIMLQILGLMEQEIVGFYKKMEDEKLDSRSIKRLINVLTLFQVRFPAPVIDYFSVASNLVQLLSRFCSLQSVAANNETRQRFIDGKPLVRCTK